MRYQVQGIRTQLSIFRKIRSIRPNTYYLIHLFFNKDGDAGIFHIAAETFFLRFVTKRPESNAYL